MSSVNPNIIERKERWARKMSGKGRPVARSVNVASGQHLTSGFPVLVETRPILGRKLVLPGEYFRMFDETADFKLTATPPRGCGPSPRQKVPKLGTRWRPPLPVQILSVRVNPGLIFPGFSFIVHPRRESCV